MLTPRSFLHQGRRRLWALPGLQELPLTALTILTSEIAQFVNMGKPWKTQIYIFISDILWISLNWVSLELPDSQSCISPLFPRSLHGFSFHRQTHYSWCRIVEAMDRYGCLGYTECPPHWPLESLGSQELGKILSLNSQSESGSPDEWHDCGDELRW